MRNYSSFRILSLLLVTSLLSYPHIRDFVRATSGANVDVNKVNVCVVVPVRARELQADVFRTFIRGKMAEEQSSYALVFAKQRHGDKFNRGMLMNCGFLFVTNKYSCGFIYFHDVDMLPSSNISYSTQRARAHDVVHLATQASQFKFKMPYPEYLSGIVGMKPTFYNEVDGFANDFWGWGAEDDEFRNRLLQHRAHIVHDYKGSVLSLNDGHSTRDFTHIERNRMMLGNISKGLKVRTGLEFLSSAWLKGNLIVENLRLDDHSWELDVDLKSIVTGASVQGIQVKGRQRQ